MFPQTRPVAPIDSESAKIAPGTAGMPGQDNAGVLRGMAAYQPGKWSEG